MSIFSEQELFDSRRHFSDNTITCWMACLMSWTKGTPFDSKIANIETFNKLMERRKWQLDEDSDNCNECRQPFSMWVRKHHCRLCGQIFCHNCSTYREVKCCYRSNLNIRACQSCFTIYSERIHLFHQLQSEWMLAENRVSDCTIQGHPKLSRDTKNREHSKKEIGEDRKPVEKDRENQSENESENESDEPPFDGQIDSEYTSSIESISSTSLPSPNEDCKSQCRPTLKPIQTIASIAPNHSLIRDSKQISKRMHHKFYLSLTMGITFIGIIIYFFFRLATENSGYMHM